MYLTIKSNITKSIYSDLLETYCIKKNKEKQETKINQTNKMLSLKKKVKSNILTKEWSLPKG